MFSLKNMAVDHVSENQQLFQSFHSTPPLLIQISDLEDFDLQSFALGLKMVYNVNETLLGDFSNKVVVFVIS